MNKVFLMSAIAAVLLSGCTATPTDKAARAYADVDRTLPIGSYLPRKKNQPPDAATVDKTQLENMQRMGAATIQGK